MEPGRNEARIVESDGEQVVELQLQQGKVCWIDLEDWDRMRHHRWYAVRHERKFYVQATLLGGQSYVYMHSLLLGCTEGKYGDHANCRSLDNRRLNLRPATPTESARNRTKRTTGVTSRFKGVSWHAAKRKWYARIKMDGKDLCLGYFVSEEDAGRKYDSAARELFGPFARLNFPEIEHLMAG